MFIPMKRCLTFLAGLALLLAVSVSARAANLNVYSSDPTMGSASGSGVYAETANVTISATPGANYVFTGWTGDTVTNPSSPTTTIIASGNKTVYANFAPKTNTLYVTVAPSGAGIVSISPTGTPSGGGQSYPVFPTTNVTLVATATGTSPAGTPYVFSGWTVVSGGSPAFTGSTSSPSVSFPMTNSYVLQANFVAGGAANYRLTIVDDPSPTIAGVQGGTVKIADGTANGVTTATYAPGVTARIVAVPSEGYQYAGFLGASITSPVTPDPADPLQNVANARVGETTVNADRNIHAHFEPIPRQLTIAASPAAAGTVAFGSTPTPLSSTSATTKVYIQGSTIPVTATPNPTYRLVSWGTTNTTDIPLSVTTLTPPTTSASTTNVGPLKASGTVTAYFEPIPIYHALTLVPGSGGVASATGSFVDPDTRTTTTVSLLSPGGATSVAAPGVLDGTTITLTATPNQNWEFTRWDGGVLNNTTNPVTIDLTADRTITPVFTQAYASLTITYDLPAAQADGAMVTVDGATPNAGGFYPIGSTLTLTPSSPAGWRFNGWGGALNGNTTPQPLPFNGDTAVTARFVRVFTLTGTATNGGLLQVGSEAPTANYPATPFDENTTVNLTAVEQPGSVFASWSGVSNSTGLSASVLMNAAKTVTANFVVVNTVSLSTSSGGSATMSGLRGIAVTDATATSGSTVGGLYNAGTSVSFTASPSPGWRFVGWDLDGDNAVTGSEPTGASTSRTVTNPPAAGLTMKAIFTQITHTVTTSITPAGAVAAGASISGNVGSVSTAGNVATYNEGDNISLTANGVTGWPFKDWIVNGVSQGANPWTTSITGITTDYTVVANFGPQYTLALAVGTANQPGAATATGGTPSITALNPAVSGAGLPNTTAVNLPGDGATVVSLQGNPSTNYIFRQWTLLDSSGNPSTAGTFANATASNTTLTITGVPGQTYRAVASYSRTYRITTAVNGTGTVSPTGTTTVTYGNTFTITATSGAPAGGWNRSDTGANITNGLATYTFSPNADATVTALFNSGYTLTLNYNPVGASSGPLPANVTISPAMPGGGYAYNTAVTLTATGTTNWSFINWTGNTNSTNATTSATATGTTLTVRMVGNRTVNANFNQLVPLTFAINPTGAGTINTPTGVTNGGVSNQVSGSNVSIRTTTSSSSNYTFLNWTVSSGAAVASPTSGTTTVLADGAKTITANYLVRYTVTAAATFAPSGSGTPPRVDGISSKTFNGTQAMALTANTPSGYTFMGWQLERPSGTVVAGEGTFADATDENTTLTITNPVPGATYIARARYARNQTITTGVDNPALGSITPNGTTIVPYGTDFTATASPAPAGWYRKVGTATATNPALTGNTHTFTVTADTTLIALYQPSQTLTVLFNPSAASSAPNAATVALNPTGGTYAYGTQVRLIASNSTSTGSDGWVFQSWTGSVTTTSSTTTYVTMNGNQTVTVNYLPKHLLTMARNPTAGGTVTAGGYFVEGATRTITATPAAGYAFVSWTTSAGSPPASTTDASTTVLIDENKTVTANFAPTAVMTVRTLSLLKAGGNDVQGDDTTASTGPGGSAGVYNDVTLSNAGTATKRITTGSYTGETVTVNAAPTAGYDFLGWDTDGNTATVEQTGTSYSFVPTGATTLTAVFQRRTVILNILLDPTGAGTAVATSNATLTAPGVYNVLYGDTVNISATPSSVYTFTEWTGSTFANATSAGTSLVVSGDTTITAHFELIAGNVDIYLFPDPSPNHGEVSAVAVSGDPLVGGGYTTVNGKQARHYVGRTGQTVAVSASGRTYLGVNYGFAIWDGADTNPGDGALLQDRTNATTSFVSTPLSGETDIRIRAVFVEIVPTVSYTAHLTVRASLDGDLLPTAGRTLMPDNWTVAGSLLDTGVTPNRPWIRLYEVFVQAQHRYAQTEVETLTVSGPPALNAFDFTGWEVTYYNGDGSVNHVDNQSGASVTIPFNLPLDETHNIVAVAKFVTVRVNLTVAKNVTGPDSAALTAQADLASVAPNGTLVSAAGAMPQVSQWLRTSPVPTLTASMGGNSDYIFEGWDLNGDTTIDNTALTIPNDPASWGPLNANASATAYFTRLNSLTVAVTPGDATGTGTISTVGLTNGVQAPSGPTSRQYRNGTAVSLLATPALHHVLHGWKIETDTDDNGSLETVVDVPVADLTTPQTYALPTLLHATKVTAIFALENVPTTFTADPVAGGSITLDGTPLGALPYTKPNAHYGETSTLLAVPAAGYLFDRWSIDVASGAANVGAPTSASTSIFIDVPKTVTAHFVAKSVLTMAATPSVPATLSVLSPAAGAHDYPTGTPVTISVSTPDIHYVFDGWTINGVPTGTPADTSLPITLTTDTTALANFTERRVLTTQVLPAISGGTITADGTGTTVSGQYLYPKGAIASVTATPGSGPGITPAGYIFDHWELNGVTTAGGNPFAILSLNDDATVTAVYVAHPGFDVTLQAGPGGGVQTLTATDGTITRNYVTTPGAARFPWHAVVTANATPAPGYVFVHWTDAGGNVVSDEASYTLPQLDGAISLIAVFEPSYRLEATTRTFPTTAPAGGTATITLPAPGGASVTLQGAAQSATLSATPSAGYVFGGWLLENTAGATSTAGAFGDESLPTTTLTLNGLAGQTYRAVAVFNQILSVTARVSDPTQGSVSPAGVTQLPYGSPLTLTATGIGIHAPTGWYYQNDAQLAANTGTIINNPAPYTFTVTENATVTALFQGSYILTVQFNPAAAGTGATPATVSLSPPSAGNSYNYNTLVTLTTANTQRWEFDSWSGPVSATTGLSTTTTMTQDQTVVANYKPRYALTLATNPAGSGTLTPAGVTYHTVGTAASISVAPSAGYLFKSWTTNIGVAPAAPNAASTTVLIDQAKTLTANMMRLWAVNVQNPAIGVGTTSPAAGIHYVTPTDANLSPNGLFTVTAVPDASLGWEFDSWESTGNITFVNGTSRETPTATILAAGDATMRPRYKLKRYDLTVTITPPGASTVSTAPLGFLPSVATATARYEHGTVATITLQPPATGYAFNSWTGDPVVIPNLADPLKATIVMNGEKNVVANFDQTRVLTVLTDPADGSGGTATGAGTYVLGQVVNVTANPAPGWRFRYWAGPVTLSSSASTSVTMSADRTILAAFEQIPPSALLTVVTAGGGASSQVTLDTSAPAASTSANIEIGSSHTATAIPGPGYVFDYWSGNPSSALTISSPASANTALIFNATSTLTANFKPKTVLVTLNYDSSAGSVTVTNGGSPVTPVSGTTNQYIFSPTDSPVFVATPTVPTDGTTNAFSRWESDGPGTAAGTQFTLAFAATDNARTVSAFFSTTTASNWTLTVDAQPPSLGSATKTAIGTDQYQLDATAGTYGEFLYWKDTSFTGNLTNTGSPSIMVFKPTTGVGSDGSVNQVVTAFFSPRQSVVVVTVSGLGTVVANSQTIQYNGDGVIAAMGSTATLSAAASTGWKLAGFIIDGVTYSALPNQVAAVTSMVLDQPLHNVLVSFVRDQRFLLDLSLNYGVTGSQATIASGSSQAGDSVSQIRRTTESQQFVEVEVRFDPRIESIYIPPALQAYFTVDRDEFMPDGSIRRIYRVLVEVDIVGAISLNPTNPALILSVNPPDAGDAFIEVSGQPPVTNGLYGAGNTVPVRFHPATDDDVFQSWDRIQGDATFVRDPAYPDDPSAYLVTMNSSAVTRLEASVRQQRRTIITRPDIDILDTSVTQPTTPGDPPILLPDAKMDDRRQKRPTHLISGREEEPVIPPATPPVP